MKSTLKEFVQYICKLGHIYARSPAPGAIACPFCRKPMHAVPRAFQGETIVKMAGSVRA